MSVGTLSEFRIYVCLWRTLWSTNNGQIHVCLRQCFPRCRVHVCLWERFWEREQLSHLCLWERFWSLSSCRIWACLSVGTLRSATNNLIHVCLWEHFPNGSSCGIYVCGNAFGVWVIDGAKIIIVLASVCLWECLLNPNINRNSEPA